MPLPFFSHIRVASPPLYSTLRQSTTIRWLAMIFYRDIYIYVVPKVLTLVNLVTFPLIG